MEKDLISFRTFDDLALAEDVANTLKQNGVQYELKTIAPKIDIATMTGAAKSYVIMAYAADFDRINDLLQQSELEDIEKVGSDYYLFGFTDEELFDVVTKADEWSAFDIVLARKILKDRGHDVSDGKVKQIQNDRIVELRQPEPSPTLWVILGYVFALLGGIIGVFIGRHLYAHKKTLPNGEMVFIYSENTRKHGRNIFYIATVCFVLAFLFRLRDFF
ncbi:hypothetical protein ACFQZS_06830 [Mucilaginibacter calamicampi]|uniref:Signal transducing protein n=1 Tax=Mucilaginibacter calamicampi TaxID=1302352 RepID=A0ABW2YVM3_9SPHI